jgi:hypothetical protein
MIVAVLILEEHLLVRKQLRKCGMELILLTALAELGQMAKRLPAEDAHPLGTRGLVQPQIPALKVPPE